MLLADYLRKRNLAAASFAQAIGVSRQTVFRYISGERMPRRAILNRIEEETQGAVTASDFLSSTSHAELAP
ncbi:MAG TPA: helix-turn-helix transcriptional regulator [Pelagibacterium sp.]|uniref:helix-turn-helix transcriptional regulator n=1 Tax=Pelagibacterium sp. TaxID=1967288 RepID=UPI002BB1D6DB|nr:helix-turn-helix transcriptional regulator [Pelagibacterium sp.]HWJ86904.1 helix-turn-helix transcriptional regulator [Pelagibacterium sp.]